MDRVCHFEVPFADKGRFESFYSKVFGWQIMPAPGDMPYSFIFTTEVDENYMPKEVIDSLKAQGVYKEPVKD